MRSVPEVVDSAASLVPTRSTRGRQQYRIDRNWKAMSAASGGKLRKANRLYTNILAPDKQTLYFTAKVNQRTS